MWLKVLIRWRAIAFAYADLFWLLSSLPAPSSCCPNISLRSIRELTSHSIFICFLYFFWSLDSILWYPKSRTNRNLEFGNWAEKSRTTHPLLLGFLYLLIQSTLDYCGENNSTKHLKEKGPKITWKRVTVDWIRLGIGF